MAEAFPSNWLLYASLNAFPANSPPIEIDLLAVMDDRIVLLELKDWHGPLTTKGDMWIHGKPQRSPVQLGNEKAKKIKSILRSQGQLGRFYVDSRIVLTGTTTRDLLPEDEKRHVLTLEEAKQLGNSKDRDRLIGTVKFQNVKPNMLVRDFDKLLGNPSYFKPMKMSWDGYNVTDEDFFVHRRDIWREHRAQLTREERIKGLLRLFRFDNLPVGLNEPKSRRLIADRELKTIAYLSEHGSWMAERGILRSVGSPPDEILTEHYQLLAIPPGWTTLRRYLERNGSELDGEQRVDIMHALTSMVAELHDRGIAHRDLGGDAIWLGEPTGMSLTGFFSSRLPDDQSVGDFLEILGTYAEPEPDWGADQPTAKQRDVRSLGLIMSELANIEGKQEMFPCGWTDISDKALASPDTRYNSARELADAIGELRTPSGPAVDQSQLDEFETQKIPYVAYPPYGPLDIRGNATRYESILPSGKVVVKIWNGIHRGNAHRDHSLLALLDVAATLKAVPQPGTIHVVDCGLSSVGPFVVTRWIDGTPLSDFVAPDENTLLSLLQNLLAAVNSLHSRGLAHGDLHPDNVLVGADSVVTLIDLLDISRSDSGRPRTMAWVPDDYERRSDQEIDRFAVCKMVAKLVETSASPFGNVLETARAELDRYVIETLDTVVEAISTEQDRRSRGPARSFELQYPGLPPGELRGVDGILWVTAHRTTGGLDVYWVTGPTTRLLLRMKQSNVDHVEVSETSFKDLGRGQKVPVAITIRPGPTEGVAEFVHFLRDTVTVRQAEVTAENKELEDIDDADYFEDELLELEDIGSASLDIARVWLRSAELEEDSVLRVRIDRRIPDSGTSATYYYETSKPLEFEDDDTVEVRLGGFSGRLIGYLDVSNCDSRRIAIRDQRSAIADGEFVALMDRRDRVSKERRRKAVERITRRSSVIPNLIDYFDPKKDAVEVHYDVPQTIDNIASYKLNAGQRAAFRHLVEHGPVGLLQGPPGSGKTKFIASLVHWLLRDGGARRVLIASQSHEAVNNVLEELLKTYRNHGGHADLLRVGSRGGTERVRSYQARSLRERHRVRFENGLKTRVAYAASAVGIPKSFVSDVVDVEFKLGTLKRSLEMARAAAIGNVTQDERRRSGARIRSLSKAFSREANRVLGREVGVEPADVNQAVVEAFDAVRVSHPKVSPSDLSTVQQLISLALQWRDTLSTGRRNFDEFLAKTRRVVAGTCVGLGQSQIRLDQGTFDWVIVDEAARCTSGELSVPLQLGSRVVLVGDQRQLRPMVDRYVQKSLRDEFLDAGPALEKTDFERAFVSSYGHRNAQVLDEQYRMVSAISDLVSETFYAPYGVKLKPSIDRVPDGAFKDLPDDLKTPVVWFDTKQTAGVAERDRNSGRDIWNEAEIATVMSILHRLSRETGLVENLLRRGEPAIGVICMYSEQKRRIEREWSQQAFPEGFRPMVTIDTVDAYQGKENEIVIVTLVRSNEERAPGHVGRENRCNVAMSRAKERLYIVGDSDMWSDPRCKSPMRTVLSKISAMASSDGQIRASTEIKQ
ncbi:serine/threonine protein kinase [Agrobacterium tumefaciens]|nr:serine/threonine protein kinase [Agrobacterium tumefaciens]